MLAQADSHYFYFTYMMNSRRCNARLIIIEYSTIIINFCDSSIFFPSDNFSIFYVKSINNLFKLYLNK